MSNAGQAALGIVGGIVGFFIGGPTGAVYGFQVGLAIGTVVSPTQLPGTFGPKLSDNRTTNSQIGAPVIEIAGTDTTMGTVIWLGRVVETATTTEVGGKGGPEQSQTTYAYNQSIAVGLCRSLRGGPMGGILQIFENGKLVYDRRPRQTGESDTAYANRMTTNSTYELGFTLYLGTEEQLPDPTIEAEKGVGNVPGYRGLMYIVFPARLLQDEQARRHPNYKFVVYDQGSLSCEPAGDYSTGVIYPWTLGDSDPRNGCNDHTYQFKPGNVAPVRDLLADAIADARSLGYPIDSRRIFAWSYAENAEYGGILPYFPNTTSIPDPLNLYLWLNAETPKLITEPIYLPDGNSLGWPECVWTKDRGPPFWWPGTNQLPLGAIFQHGVRIYAVDQPSGYENLDPSRTAFCEGDPASIWLIKDVPIEVRRVPKAPPVPCDPDDCGSSPYTPSSIPGYCYDASGKLVQATAWALDTTRNWKVLQKYGAGATITRPVNPIRPEGHPQYSDQAFWEAAYNEAVDAGLVPAGWTYNLEYPQPEDHGYYREFLQCSTVTDLVSIADIVRGICNRCDLPDDLIDVTDLEDRYVNGYSLARVMDGRSAVAVLRSVGFFDAVESGGILKFPVRGRAIVRTLTSADLGAHDYNEDTPPLITTKQLDDVELPRQLFVQYRDPERNYEVGEQPSPTRLTTTAVNDVYVDVAVAMSATQAARCAEVLWSDQWASRWQHAIALSTAQLDLDPTDNILVPVNGRNERMRIVAADDSSLVLRQITLVRDDDGSYVSEAVSDPAAVPPATMIFYAATQIVILDLPALRAADDDPGFYIAVGRSSNGNRWGGATIYRSVDGAAFAVQGSVANEAMLGTVHTALAGADAQVIDEGNELIVTLPQGQFSSASQEDVEAGANALAIGAHGRWEIVQFCDAELIGTTRWRLTRLLRGRRGTDHNIGTSQAGDRAVLISGAGIIRLLLSIPEVGRDFIYRAVTNGTPLGTGIDTTFAGSGEALRPFSPVHIHGDRDTAGDGALTVTWLRRDRLLIQYQPGAATPMSESIEDYEIDVIDSDGLVRRTISTNDTQAVYSAAMQITDFGALQSSVTVRIYQLSVAIGRGHYREATL